MAPLTYTYTWKIFITAQSTIFISFQRSGHRPDLDRQNSDKGYETMTNSDLNRPCFAWHPYGKLGLFKTELVIAPFFIIIDREAREIM